RNRWRSRPVSHSDTGFSRPCQKRTDCRDHGFDAFGLGRAGRSTMSNTSTAVLAGFSVTGTGSGIGGICSVSIGLAPPFPGNAATALCAVADSAYVANAREVTRARLNELMRMLPFSG